MIEINRTINSLFVIDMFTSRYTRHVTEIGPEAPKRVSCSLTPCDFWVFYTPEDRASGVISRES